MKRVEEINQMGYRVHFDQYIGMKFHVTIFEGKNLTSCYWEDNIDTLEECVDKAYRFVLTHYNCGKGGL